jgi:hypothetical protein
MSLDSIDTSYWLTKDKDWKEQRNAQWPAIEKVVGINRNKAEVNVIKAYFLRGKMPNWEKYKDWDKTFRHLDLRMFLWLHPSDDPEVLKPLYKTYMESEVIHAQDVTAGYGSLLDNELLSATSPYKSLKDYPFPFMGNKNIILFRIFFEDIAYAKKCMVRLLGGQKSFDGKASHLFEYSGYNHFLRIWIWLMQDATSPLMLNGLYQYDEVLDWCLTTITNNSNNEFIEGLKTPAYVTEFQKALYCIYHFDDEKPEVSCRSRALVKVRQLLDENDFIPEFKQMWEGIKLGEIEVKTPWKRR